MNLDILKQIIKEFEKLKRCEGLRLGHATMKCSPLTLRNEIDSLRIDPPELTIPSDPAEFIAEFIKSHRHTYSTIKPDNTILTGKGRQRSFNEIYDICLTYYPGYNLESYFSDFLKAARILYETMPENGAKVISVSFCSTIVRPVTWLHTEDYCNGYNLLKSNNTYNLLRFWKSSPENQKKYEPNGININNLLKNL